MKKILLIINIFMLLISSGQCAIASRITIVPVQGSVMVGFDKDNLLDDDSKIEEWEKLDWTEIVEKMYSSKRTYIDTGEDGYANVMYDRSGSLIRILPDTKLFIEMNNIYVYSGTSFYKIDKQLASKEEDVRLVVRTPTAIAGIRGTEFEVAVEEFGDKSDFSVYEGQIEVVSEKDEDTHLITQDKKVSVFDGKFKGRAVKFEGKARRNKFWGDGSWKQRFEDRMKKIEMLKKFKKFNLLKPEQANGLFKKLKPDKIREMLNNNSLINYVKSDQFQGGLKNWKARMTAWKEKMKNARAERIKRRNAFKKDMLNKMKKFKNDVKNIDKSRHGKAIQGIRNWAGAWKEKFGNNAARKQKNALPKNAVQNPGLKNAWQNWIEKLKQQP